MIEPKLQVINLSQDTNEEKMKVNQQKVVTITTLGILLLCTTIPRIPNFMIIYLFFNNSTTSIINSFFFLLS